MAERRPKKRWYDIEDKATRPWYKTWWVYAIAAFVVILLMALTAPEGDAASWAVGAG